MILIFVFVIKFGFPFVNSHCIRCLIPFVHSPFLKYIDISLITAPPQKSFSMVENEMHTDGLRNAYDTLPPPHL